LTPEFSAIPAGLTARARPKARPETRTTNLPKRCSSDDRTGTKTGEQGELRGGLVLIAVGTAVASGIL
jgi:hypothetical protein